MKKHFLVADIGGTNTSIALITHEESQFEIRSRRVYPTHRLASFAEALRATIKDFESEGVEMSIDAACLSIAGPVKNQRCIPTNINWSLNGHDIEKEFGFKTIVINDLTALCYGIPLLSINDAAKITPLPHPDGTTPPPQEYLPGIGIRAVVAAGTGLGVGYLIEEHGRLLALPAEGGHADFSPHSKMGRELLVYTEETVGRPMNAESLVSGLGIARIFHFMKERMGADSAAIREIANLSDREKPAAISKQAKQDESCKKIIILFIEMYARVAHNIALTFIPRQGLFLAGGIAAKNKEFFLEDNRFMKTFLHNITKTVSPLLRDIPVYIVEDYRSTLYGSANALVQAADHLKQL